MLPGRKYAFEDIVRIARRRAWLILLPFVIVSVATVVLTRRLPDEYRSETTIMVIPQRVPESYVRSTVTNRIEDRLHSLQQQVTSRSRLERIILDLNLFPNERSASAMEDLIGRMRAAIKVDTVRGDAFTVSYVSPDPRTAQIVTERLASLFIEENVRDREVLADGTSEFLQVQLDDARKRLMEQEKKLEVYRMAHSGELPSQATANLQGLQTGRMQSQALVDSIIRDRDRQLIIERQLADLLAPDASGGRFADATPSAPGGPSTPRLSPPDELAQVQSQLRLMEGRLTDAHPDMRRLRRRAAQLEQLTAEGQATATLADGAGPVVTRSPADLQREWRVRETRAELDAVTRRILAQQQQQQRLQQETAQYQARLEAVPIRESEQTELMRDYETLQQIYRSLLSKREDSKIAANLERRQVGEQFRVLDPALAPERPFSPDRVKLNGIGILLGLFIGLGLVAALEFLDTTLKTEDDVRTVLALPVIATIPILASRSRGRGPGPRARWTLGAARAAVMAIAAGIPTRLRG